MMGSRLVAADTPATIASFGSGSVRISVRVIIPQGAAAYSSALRKDVAARKEAGTELLLQNQRITVSATGRRQLADGRVDSRLLLTLANLSSQWPVSVVEFGDFAPGASPGIPLRCADLAEASGRASPNPADRVRLMSVFVHQLGEFYAGARFRTVHLAGGRDVLRIEFTAPSQFGLLGPLAP
jgi:hypothetical protein